ncbi:hypothetical protein SAMN05192561_10816 [Halopenitus malekzadehii]|uniref:HVO-0234-like beta-propeller domain-containing protein n=1 Tax=Halopenitus malekzadehii TaxID=1267564 RepID=A0A1H6J4C0_9EURY|nr:hypothetical protein [Halopenitus malekzadehii]SEH56916.1 hypothetical protein SAMN05192561_10816 [Halopenitus malekzadehii]
MPAEDDISIEEKRVYAGSAGRTDVYLASADGLVRVAVSGDKIGEFGMVADVAARDVAIHERPDAPALLAVATPEDLLVGAVGELDDGLGGLEAAGIGSTAAVGLTNATRSRGVGDGSDDGTGGVPRNGTDGPSGSGGSDRFLAATADGDVVDVRFSGADEETARPTIETTTIGSVEEPHAVDSGLIAAADGVHRAASSGGTMGGTGGSDGRSGLERVGLRTVRDVAGTGVPLAAADDGLYWLANGWMAAIEAATGHVAADGDGHALAATGEGLVAHAGTDWSREAWEPRSLPVAGDVTALAYGPGIALAATDAGALCVDAGDGWRHQILGVREVGGIATHAVA